MKSTVTILDGGTGRELKRIGAPFRQPEWSALALIEAPSFVTRVHESYIAAGADVITTNSYALVPFHIGAERFERDGSTLIDLSGRLARAAAEAAERPIDVAGSLPPICGSYRAEWFEPEFARPILTRLVVGLRPHVSHWQAETLSTIAEAELVREVVGDDGKPLWLSFTLQDDHRAAERAPRLRSGEDVQSAVGAAARLGAAAILFNCSQPEVMGPAVTAARDAMAVANRAGDPPLRIGVYANAFAALRKQAEANAELNAIRTDLTPAGYLQWVRDWLERGADIVGGCCGIGPEHIRAIRAAIGRLPGTATV